MSRAVSPHPVHADIPRLLHQIYFGGEEAAAEREQMYLLTKHLLTTYRNTGKTFILQNDEGQIELTHSVSAGLDYAAIGPEHAFYRDLNRIEFAQTNLKTTIQNFTAAESVIRDVDMAEEMTKFSKNNILAQAGTAMLAQANQSAQGVLQLLRG